MRRSIPACAGEPPDGDAGPTLRAVYPRLCGGTRQVGSEFVLSQGLSPLVRGNPPPPQEDTDDAGSIPACAGEPCAHRAVSKSPGVYPRLCGGTKVRADCPPLSVGLSPLVRGNLPFALVVPGGPGSIPACAGEPIVWTLCFYGYTVYPRLCGGTAPRRHQQTASGGLSPLVRGNR